MVQTELSLLAFMKFSFWTFEVVEVKGCDVDGIIFENFEKTALLNCQVVSRN